MQPNRTLFFVIIGLAIILTIGIVGGGFFFLSSNNDLAPLRSQGSPIQVVVAPSIKPWVDQAAEVYNQTNPGSRVTVVEADDLIPKSRFQNTSQDLPVAAWLPEASFVAALAKDQGVSFQDPKSVANTALVWGAYNDKLNQFTQTYGNLNWESVHEKAVSADDFLKLVIASPHDSAEGIAALISATAASTKMDKISGNSVSTADAWLTQTFGNRNAQTPPTPAEAFASVQGRTLGDVGILSMTSWQNAGLQNRSDFTLTPVEPNVTLDYPFVILTGPQVRPEAQAAANRFRQFLLGQDQQAKLANFFLNPASSPSGSGQVQADASAVERLLSWADRALR